LDSADVVTILQKVGGKAMAEGMATDSLGDPGFLDGLLDRPL